MEQVIEESTARQNFNMLLLTIFAATACCCLHRIYGLMAYSVQQRTTGDRHSHRAGSGSRTCCAGDSCKACAWRASDGDRAGRCVRAYAGARGLLFNVKATTHSHSRGGRDTGRGRRHRDLHPGARATRIDQVIALRYE